MQQDVGKTNVDGFTLSMAMLVMLAIVGGLIYAIWNVGTQPELQIGLLILTAVAVLLVLLFAVAISLSRVGILNRDQALGLPEGSIRALISLFLIMLFIVISVYLVSSISNPRESGYGKIGGLSSDQYTQLLGQYGDRVLAGGPDGAGSSTYFVTVRPGTTDDGIRLAQQLMTTVGTLVVAVAGFYFGSTVTASAGQRATSTGTGGQGGTAPVETTPPGGAAKSDQASELAAAGMNNSKPKLSGSSPG